jgi:hypothetical protein
MTDEIEAIRQTFRVTLTLTGAACGLTYLLAEWSGFDRPLQAGLIVMLVCLAMLAIGILLIVLTQRFCEVLEVGEPEGPIPRPPVRRAMSVFSNTREKNSSLDLYLQRIYREVAPGDRSYIRKGGLNPARPKSAEPRPPAPATISVLTSGGLQRPVLAPRSEPFRVPPGQHPKPHREPRG